MHCSVRDCAHFRTDGSSSFESLVEGQEHWRMYHPQVLSRLERSDHAKYRVWMGWTPCPKCATLCLGSVNLSAHEATCESAERGTQAAGDVPAKKKASTATSASDSSDAEEKRRYYKDAIDLAPERRREEFVAKLASFEVQATLQQAINGAAKWRAEEIEECSGF